MYNFCMKVYWGSYHCVSEEQLGQVCFSIVQRLVLWLKRKHFFALHNSLIVMFNLEILRSNWYFYGRLLVFYNFILGLVLNLFHFELLVL